MERKGKAKLTAAMCAVAVAVCSVAPAVEFAGGTGEPNDPYQIATAAQLIGLGEEPNLYDKHFILTADIDLDPNLPGRTIYEEAVIRLHTYETCYYPRGGAYPCLVRMPLVGAFDGNGHAIRNYVVHNRTPGSHGGLFAIIGEEGRVSNLRLENVLVANVEAFGEGSLLCGALAGENAGTVTNCSATGTIMASSLPNDAVGGGGLVGRNRGVLAACSARCYVSGFNVGGLVGVNDASALIVSSFADGGVYGFRSTVSYRMPVAGGLVGHNAGLVIDCHAHGDVSSAGPGGLIAVNADSGRIVLCSADGITRGYVPFGHTGGSAAGGLVGSNAGLVQYCCAGGSVHADDVGGLVANNAGSVRESYANADVFGETRIGSLIAGNHSEVVNCYAAGVVGPSSGRHSSRAVGFVGSYGAQITACYCVTVEQQGDRVDAVPLVGHTFRGRIRYGYYVDANETAEPNQTEQRERGTPLDPSEINNPLSFRGFDFHGDSLPQLRGPWVMPETGPPVLAWQTEITGLSAVPDLRGLDLEEAVFILEHIGLAPGVVTHDYFREEQIRYEESSRRINTEGQVGYTRPQTYAPAGSEVDLVVSLGPYDFAHNPGSGTEADPYRIETAGQLDGLHVAHDLWSSHFLLATDIDLYGRHYERSLVEAFAGTFNGNGHVIRGLHISTPWPARAGGMFKRIEPTGVVHDLMIEGAVVDAGGILASTNVGHIFRCSTSGIVGSDGDSQYVGGLVGYNRGSICCCSATDVRVLGWKRVGGLVGSSKGADAVIEASYARGIVEGVKSVGGLLGANGGKAYGPRGEVVGVDAGTVRQSYASCLVVGQDDVGGCIGYADPNAVQEACYFLASGDGGGPDNGLGTALSSVQMQRQSSFVDWDFAETWMICEGQGYPHLLWEGFTCQP